MSRCTTLRRPRTSLFALSDRAFVVFHAMKKLGGCPSLNALAELTGKSTPTIYRALAELHDAGFPVALSPSAAHAPVPPAAVREQRRNYTGK